ncbi:hypothetical protein KC356_g316 [Hortaea werneckii]|nr:hypothetical protein KC356_g316 [Hortaea werneckii]
MCPQQTKCRLVSLRGNYTYFRYVQHISKAASRDALGVVPYYSAEAHTLSIASRSSSVTEICWAPGGNAASSSPSSAKSCMNCSGKSRFAVLPPPWPPPRAEAKSPAPRFPPPPPPSRPACAAASNRFTGSSPCCPCVVPPPPPSPLLARFLGCPSRGTLPHDRD